MSEALRDSGTGAQGRILLVEDNPLDLELARIAFEACGLAELVSVVRDGQEALDCLLGPDEAPRLVLLDLHMPRVSGHEVLERIRGLPNLSGTRVVVLTTSNNDADRRRCEALGASGYVVKPPDFEEFVRLLDGLAGSLRVVSGAN